MSSTPSPVAVASQSELTSTFGVLLIGFIFSVVLYGLTFFQTYIYYTRFPADHKGTKCLVGVLWALDTAVTALISHTLYRFLITNFMTAFDELSPTKTFIIEEVLATLLILFVQCYYAFRVWTITERQFVLPAFLVSLAVASAALDIVAIAQIAQQGFFFQIVTDSVKMLRGIAFGIDVATDLVIVGAMFWYMQPTRNPGMARPDGWYEKTVVYCFNRGTAFTVIQILYLIIFLTMPSSQAWILVGWVTSKVYVNSALALLNFRNSHRGRGVHEEDSLNQAASNRSGTLSAPPVGPRETGRSVQFNVDPDIKARDPMSIIELDMVGSRADGYDDDNGKDNNRWIDAGGPSKRRDFDDNSSQ